MRFLLDEGMSPRVAEVLSGAGHDARHVRDLGLASANDPIVLQAARDDDRVLLTLDTDFGALLAHSGAALPSVVLFRGDVTRRPAGQAQLLLANLDQIEPALLQGALVVIGDGRLRVRTLPMDR